MRLRSRSFGMFAMLGVLFGMMPVSVTHAERVNMPGVSLIRGTTSSSVYFLGANRLRYVFPNEKTYFTWHSNFDDVVAISDADLANIQIDGNITYRPGEKMVKINSDPKVYMVFKTGELRWVPTEAMAQELYGADWATKIDDVPDSFFGNYSVGTAVTEEEVAAVGADTFVNNAIAEASSETEDFNFVMSDVYGVNIGESSYGGKLGGTFEVYTGDTVSFENDDTQDHTATADDNTWDTGTLHSGDASSHRFTKVGTYPYHCKYHPEMTGTITVIDR